MVSPLAEVHQSDQKLQVVVRHLSNADTVRICFRSDRNIRISKHSDRSPLAPGSYDRRKIAHDLVWGAEAPPQNREIYFPIVDLDLSSFDVPVQGEFVLPAAQRFTVNSWKTDGFMSADRAGAIQIDQPSLENWENWILAVGPIGSAFGAASFEIVAFPEVEDGIASLTAISLGHGWSGQIHVEVIEPVELKCTLDMTAYLREMRSFDPALGSLAIDAGNSSNAVSDDREALEEDLALCLDFILSSKNKTKGSPFEGGLYLFYDIDARTWRAPNWTWTWGPSIGVALDSASQVQTLQSRAPELEAFAREVGNVSLSALIERPGHPSHGMGIARWDPLPEVQRGSEKFASLADTLFLAGWAWGRLYDHTGDERYLEGMRTLAAAAERQISEFGVIQQDWLFGRGRWLERILDEAGFGTKGLAELHRLTGEAAAANLAGAYLDPLIDRLGREDGLWDRFWYVAAESRTPSENMLRGLGWALEGLLSAYDATGNEAYLESASKMADVVISHQRDDGAWTFQFDLPVEEVGLSEKGTALFSGLFYRLHDATGDQRYLDAARAALAWARSRLRRGADDEARGGIVGINAQSGIAYRPWFRVCCTYSTAFTGAAILEELRLRRDKEAN